MGWVGEFLLFGFLVGSRGLEGGVMFGMMLWRELFRDLKRVVDVLGMWVGLRLEV